MKLYSNQASGNCYKIRLVAHQLGLPCEIHEMDLVGGDCRTAEYRALNPFAKTPAVVLDDGTLLCESNAIMLYLAQGTDLLPTDRLELAFVHQWLFWEQYSHEPVIAVARWSYHYVKNTAETDPRLPDLWEKGKGVLKMMDDHLAKNDFFAAGRYTIADIALFAYTHVAEEGNFDLSGYPNVNAWIERIKKQPNWQPMDKI